MRRLYKNLFMEPKFDNICCMKMKYQIIHHAHTHSTDIQQNRSVVL